MRATSVGTGRARASTAGRVRASGSGRAPARAVERAEGARRPRRRRRGRSCRRAAAPSRRRSGRAARSGRPYGTPAGSRARCTRAVEDLDRPGAQGEQAERDPDERGEPADADEEAGAAEVRRVGARVRLDAAAVGQGARERDPARGIGAGDGYGGGRSVTAVTPTRPQAGASSGRLLVRELVRDERERDAAPGELRLAEQRRERARRRPAAPPRRRRGGRAPPRARPAARAMSSSPASRSAATASSPSSRCGSPPAASTSSRAPARAVQLGLADLDLAGTSQTSTTSSSASGRRGPRPRAPLAGIAAIARLALAAAELQACSADIATCSGATPSRRRSAGRSPSVAAHRRGGYVLETTELADLLEAEPSAGSGADFEPACTASAGVPRAAASSQRPGRARGTRRGRAPSAGCSRRDQQHALRREPGAPRTGDLAVQPARSRRGRHRCRGRARYSSDEQRRSHASPCDRSVPKALVLRLARSDVLVDGGDRRALNPGAAGGSVRVSSIPSIR